MAIKSPNRKKVDPAKVDPFHAPDSNPPATDLIFVAPNGSDSAAGNQQFPLRSLAAACGRARPGTCIILAPGTYAPTVLAGVRGTADQPIVLRGQSPPPIDWTTVQEVATELYAVPLREALTAGKFTLAAADELAVIDGHNQPVGLLVQNCAHLQLENLVIRAATTNLAVQGSTQVTVRDCVVTGAESETGVALDLDTTPNRSLRFERVLAYGMQENGFAIKPLAVFDAEWECCLAHGMNSRGGDGFCFQHVAPANVDYRIRLVRCVALGNRLDGFDLGKGVGGVTMQFCLGDGNAWAEYYAKDLKVWSGGNTFRRCRMTGRIQFVSGTSMLEDFRSGTKFNSPEAFK